MSGFYVAVMGGGLIVGQDFKNLKGALYFGGPYNCGDFTFLGIYVAFRIFTLGKLKVK